MHHNEKKDQLGEFIMSKEKLNDIISSLLMKRIVSYNDQREDVSRIMEENELWEDTNYIDSIEGVREWLLSLREYVWGTQNSYLESKAFWSVKDEQYYFSRVALILGEELFSILKDDESIDNFLTTNIDNANDLLVKKMLINDIEREKIFSSSQNNIEINYQKITYEKISALANIICSEFKIKQISFSDMITDVDCFKYLLEVAYNFKEFSDIIKSKNIGFNALSLCFECSNKKVTSFYDLNFKAINFSVYDGFGAFSHEWMHFVDHQLSEKKYFKSSNNDLFSMGAINHSNNPLYYLNKDIKEKFKWEDPNDIRSLYAKTSFLNYSNALIRNSMKDIENIDLKNKIISHLDLTIFKIRNVDNKKQVISEWDDWKKETFKSMKGQLLNDQEKLFDIVKYIESICVYSEKEIVEPSWVVYSKMIDELRGQNYLSRNDEMLARSFEMYVFQKMMKKTWVSYKKEYSFYYPKDKELNVEMLWWDKNLHKIINLLR